MQSKQAAAGVFKVKNGGKTQHQTSSNQCLCYSCFLSKRVDAALWSSNCSCTVAIKTLSEPFCDRSMPDEIARCSALLFFSSRLPLLILLTGSRSLWCPQDCARWRGGAPLCGEGGEPFNNSMRHFCLLLGIQSSEANDRTLKANKWAKQLVEVEVQNKTKQGVSNREGWGQGWSKLGRPSSCTHEKYVWEPRGKVYWARSIQCWTPATNVHHHSSSEMRQSDKNWSVDFWGLTQI